MPVVMFLYRIGRRSCVNNKNKGYWVGADTTLQCNAGAFSCTHQTQRRILWVPMPWDARGKGCYLSLVLVVASSHHLSRRSDTQDSYRPTEFRYFPHRRAHAAPPSLISFTPSGMALLTLCGALGWMIQWGNVHGVAACGQRLIARTCFCRFGV